MNLSPQARAFLWVNLSCLCWAGNLAVGRLLRDAIGPGMLVCLRTLIAAILLAALARFVVRNKKKSVPGTGAPRPWGLLLLMAGTGIVGYQGLLYQGLHTTGAFNAALINACAPLVTALMAWAVHGSRLPVSAYAGILLSMIGVGVILSGGDWARLLAVRFVGGDLLILIAVLLWAVYALAGRKVMQQNSVISTTALATGLALPLSLPWALLEHSRESVEWTVGLRGGICVCCCHAGLEPCGQSGRTSTCCGGNEYDALVCACLVGLSLARVLRALSGTRRRHGHRRLPVGHTGSGSHSTSSKRQHGNQQGQHQQIDQHAAAHGQRKS